MAKTNPTVGLSVREAWAEAEAELAGSEDGAATPDPAATTPVKNGTEQPTVTPTSDEDVDLLSDLDDDNAGDGDDGEQPSGDDSQVFEVKGEKVTLKELLAGYERHSDYTKKTQEVAAERETLSKAKTLWDAMQNDPVGTLKQLQAAVNSGRAPVATQPTTEKSIDELVAEKVAEALGSSPEVQTLKSAAETKQLDDTFAGIEKDFGLRNPLSESDRDRVVAKAKELGISDPAGYRVVFGGLLQEAQMRKAQRDNLKKTSTASGRGTNGESNDDAPKEIESFWDAAREAAKELGLESLL